MNAYTAFCCDSRRISPTWIEAVEAETPEAAEAVALEACAVSWERWKLDEKGSPILDDDGAPVPDFESIHCLGLAEGTVNFLMWDDLC